MPSQVRIIRERNSRQWDDLVADVIGRNAHGVEHDYFGCGSEQRADEVRRKIRTAAKRAGVGSKVFWKPCPSPGQCKTGGDGCTHHVYYTLFDMEVARAYKAQQAEQLRAGRR